MLYYEWLDMLEYFSSEDVKIGIRELPCLVKDDKDIIAAADEEEKVMAVLRGGQYITFLCDHDDIFLKIDDSEIYYGNPAILSERDWEQVTEIVYGWHGDWDQIQYITPIRSYTGAAIINIINAIHAEWVEAVANIEVMA